MNRTFALLSAALGIAGLFSLTSEARAQQPAPGGAPAPAAATAPQTRPTIAVFNMAAVMRDFGQAKYQVYLLNQKKEELSKNLLAWRGEYIQVAQDLKANPKQPESAKKETRLRDLQRQIEDENEKVNKALNDSASAIIGDLYDKMKTVVDRTAEMNGYHIVFAYPDAVTPEELKNPYIKELKLKPPAAQPFYVAGHADITGVVVKALNAWYPPTDAQGKVVDVNKLPETNVPGNGVPGAAPAPGQPQVQPAPVVPGGR